MAFRFRPTITESGMTPTGWETDGLVLDGIREKGDVGICTVGWQQRSLIYTAATIDAIA
jgi:hypothetical protein